MNKPIIINIEWIKIIIEKGEEIKTIPEIQHPIQYNQLNIKRRYYKKSDPEYKRKSFWPLCKPTTISKFLRSDKTVIQEPLLDPYC